MITALREQARGRVEIHLDDRPWRVVPADAVVRAGLAVGRALDRDAARTLARELRRAEALKAAAGVLRHRDVSRRRLDERLERRGVRADARRDALATLERAGLVDDARVAEGRARSLAGRGYGDAAIRFALEDDGVDEEHVAAALAALEPERERAARLLGGGAGDVKALRRLAAKGFDAETLAELTAFADDG
ncbi:MAG TPA: RecX family transcriptional regulator [Gaiellaceae bacterium]